ncbi:hypothetical protein ACFX10_027776 [Malus domestica]
MAFKSLPLHRALDKRIWANIHVCSRTRTKTICNRCGVAEANLCS